MRLLAKVILDKIAEYLPGLDTDQLHVDVLNGRCFVENADCTPGPAFVFAGLPFRLTAGHFASLELKVPWKNLPTSPVRICASNVSFRFEEVAFPNLINEVRHAYRMERKANLNAKKDGDKPDTLLSRLSQKLFALIVDRIELDLSDITFTFVLSDGYNLTLHFGKVSTVEKSPSSSRHLAKHLSFRDVTLDISKNGERRFTVSDGSLVKLDFSDDMRTVKQLVSIPVIEISLKVRGGSTSLIVNTPCVVGINFESILVDALVSLKKNRFRWELLISEKRLLTKPKDSPFQDSDSRSWFTYATQLVVRRHRGLRRVSFRFDGGSLFLDLTALHFILLLSFLEELFQVAQRIAAGVKRFLDVILLQFFLLFEFLAIHPNPPRPPPSTIEIGNEGVNETQPMVPIELSVQNICVHVMAPSVNEVLSGGDEAFLLRVRGKLEMRFGKDMAYVTANARISADVWAMNEGAVGRRDQLFAQTDVKVKIHTGSVQVSVSVPRSIMLTVSPLTVKAVTLVSLLVDDLIRQVDELSMYSGVDAALALTRAGQDNRPEYLINVRGIVMSLVAEEPRAHLMRLVFRDVKCYLKLPVDGLSWGAIDAEIGDIVLEDVISSRICDANGNGKSNTDDDNRGNVEWRTMFAGATDLYKKRGFKTGPGRYLEILPKTTVPQSEWSNGSAKDLVKSFHKLDLDEKQRRLQPCSAAEFSREELPCIGDDSFVSLRAKWQHPVQSLTLHLVVKPLDIHVNPAILPSLLTWTVTISQAVTDIFEKLPSSTTASTALTTNLAPYPALIGVDRLVIEPITIRLATKAPPRPQESSAFRRLLDWCIGAESVAGLTFQGDRISVNGNFSDFEGIAKQVKMEYRNTLLSRSMMKQLMFQISSLSTLSRVGASTYLRGNTIMVVRTKDSPSPTASLTPVAFNHSLATSMMTRDVTGGNELILGLSEILNISTQKDDDDDEKSNTTPSGQLMIMTKPHSVSATSSWSSRDSSSPPQLSPASSTHSLPSLMSHGSEQNDFMVGLAEILENADEDAERNKEFPREPLMVFTRYRKDKGACTGLGGIG